MGLIPKIERESSDREERMLTSISFLQSASASALASSQQLWMGPKLLTAASSSTQRVSPSPSPSLVIQAKAKTRREDRTARHIRIRKKVPTLFFSSSDSDSLRFEPQLLKCVFDFIALEVTISICLSNAYVMFAKLPQ